MTTGDEIIKIQIEKMQTDIINIQEDIEQVKCEQRSLEKEQLKLNMSLQSYSEKFSKIESGIETITKEVRGVSDKLLTLQVKESIQHGKEPRTKEGDSTSLFGKLMESNNKVLYIVCLCLGVALLFSLGMNTADIAQFLQ